MTDHLLGDPDAGRPRTENDDPLLGPAPVRARATALSSPASTMAPSMAESAA